MKNYHIELNNKLDFNSYKEKSRQTHERQFWSSWPSQ